jgi:hypothetical protein
MTNSQPQTQAEPPENPASPKKVRAAERRVMALELRKQGASYRRIAKQMKATPGISPGYSEGAAYKDVMSALHQLVSKQDELAQENLRLDLDRLDEMLATFWPAAKKLDVQAFNAVMGVLDRRAKLLNYIQQGNAPLLNIDMTKLTDEQIDRIAKGENPITVLATPSAS